MSISELMRNYVFQEMGAEAALRIGDEDDTFYPSVKEIAPLAITPFASPFGKRRQERSFPLRRKREGISPERQGIVPEYEESGDPDYEKITIEDLPTSLETLLGDTSKKGKVDIFGRPYQIGPEVQKATFGIPQTFNPGYAIGQFASLAGSPISPTYLGEKNLQQLQYVQSMAALGKKGYGVGVVNGQVVGVSPNSSNILGLTASASPEDKERIRNYITGEAGPMKTGVEIFQSKTGPNITLSNAELKYQNEVLKAKGIPDNIKAELLGFPPSNVPEYIRGLEAYRKGDPKQLIQNFKTAQSIGKNLGTGVGVSGDLEGKSTDSLIGVEDEVITPDMTPITNIENITGKGLEGVSYGSLEPYYETSDSDDDYDADSQSMGDTGFDGGGGYATAYGGRIGMSNGGFASKVETIKGVGLIKPEKTFMDTDVVDDRFAFDAESGDYIINGPASDKKKSQINTLINYAVDQLGKEGVDIRVGNPKIKSKDKVPLLTASSETYIPRIIAEKIGYPILDALNNTGKSQVKQLKNKLDDRPTDESKYKASEGTLVKKPTTGSFMTMEEANKALGVKSEPINPKTLKLFKSYNKKFKPQRGDVEKLLDNMSDKDKLALLIATETISTKDPFETLESVGQVVINRINDKQFPDFKNVNTLDEVLKQRSSRGTGTKMFQFDGLEPTSVKNRINEFLNKGGMKGYKRALMAAENVLTKGGGEPDYMTDRMPFNVLFYDKAGSPTSISRRYKGGKDIGPNKLIDEYGKVGDHTFYTLHMTKEYP